MGSDSKQQAAAAELLRRRQARGGMRAFREYMAQTGSEDFKHPPARHHELMIDRLERLERGEIQRLLILAPPGSAKSTYCSIQFALWYLARHPERNILCASNSEALAENFNRRRRNMALTPEWAEVSQTKLAADLQGVGHFGTDRQGGIRAAGVGSAIVGFRSHLNLLDDPVSGVEQAMSGVSLNKQWEWYQSEYRTRLRPDGQEIIVSTRWASRDIAGRILEQVRDGKEQWEILRLPMVADSEDDPLGRPIGESLWPEYFGPAFIREKQQNPLLWSTQFQQVPLDDKGTWVGSEHIHYEHAPPQPLNHVIAVDLALSVGKGDWTVLVVAGIDRKRRLHIVDVVRERVGPDTTVERIFALCEKYRPSEVLIDDDNASKVLIRLMVELGRTRGRRPPPIRAIPIRGRDKETRAAAIRGLFLTNTVAIVDAPWNTTLHRELVEFPASEHDDQVDALSLIGRRYPSLGNPILEDALGGSYRDSAEPYFDHAPQLEPMQLEPMFEDYERTLNRRQR